MAIVKYWSVQRFDTGAGLGTGTFANDTSLPRPGIEPYAFEFQSNVSYQILADGSLARIVQETKATLRSLQWRWSYGRSVPVALVDKLYNQLKEYERLDKGVRITLDTDDQLTGFFGDVHKNRLVRGRTANPVYDVSATFHPFDVAGVGYSLTGASLYL